MNKIEIEQIENVIKITNMSIYKLIVSQIPERPKRAYRDIFLVSPGTFIILDGSWDITSLSFRFRHFEIENTDFSD